MTIGYFLHFHNHAEMNETRGVVVGDRAFTVDDGCYWQLVPGGWAEIFPALDETLQRLARRHAADVFNLRTPDTEEITMTDTYKPAMGDRARIKHWSRGHPGVTVLLVDGNDVVGRFPPEPDGTVGFWPLDEEWEEVVIYPESWINVYDSGIGDSWSNRTSADMAARPAGMSKRVGVLHLHPEGHTEMEAP